MAASTLIDLSQLPAPAVVEVLDFESYVSAYKADLITRDSTLTDVLADEAEPIVKLVEACAYRELLIRNRINMAAKANMLAYATGPDLDNLVANLGVQRLSGEPDTALLDRATLAPDGWSTAGPRNAYVYHAKSASPLVADVALSQPTPGQVRVAVLSSAVGGMPTADVLAAVTAALNDEDVRPFTDQVVVVGAATATYDVIAQLSVLGGADASLVQAAATAAVQAYAAAQRKLNSKMTLKKLTAALMQPGVDDFTLNLTADIPAQAEIAPELGQLTITTTVEDGDD